MNQLVDTFLTICGHQMSDSTGEERACYHGRRTVRLIKAALHDGQITAGEAREFLREAIITDAHNQASFERNIQVQREMEAFEAALAALPPDATARARRAVPAIEEEQRMFSAEAVFSADIRRRYPQIGNVTIGQVLAASDYDEAA